MPFVLRLRNTCSKARLACCLKVFRVLAYDGPMDLPLTVFASHNKIGEVAGLKETEVRGHYLSHTLLIVFPVDLASSTSQADNRTQRRQYCADDKEEKKEVGKKRTMK